MKASTRTVLRVAMLASGLGAAALAHADEGGVSFWLPGQYSSFAAAPGNPGWTFPVVYLHLASDAGDGREFRIGGRIAAGVDVRADLLAFAPTYVLATPVAGGQATISMTALVGEAHVGVDATLTGPGGGTLSGSESDSRFGIGDLYPTASLRWNHGRHNTMTYVTAGVPVGAYDADRLANLGTNHWSLDAGVGYTYLDQEKGREFSAVFGATHNFENEDTDYRNGASLHLDWGASQFLSATTHIGLAGYVYHQVGGDSGAGATLGDFKSRVVGIGPQIGWFIPVDGRTWYAGLRGYAEFAARNRPEGWNVWFTLAIPLGPAPTAAP